MPGPAHGPTRLVLPVPFPLETVNAWWFPGSEPALVDCGIGSSMSYKELRDQLGSAGADPTGARLYITHGHVDHAGNAKRLKADFGVTLHAPAAEAPFVETFRRDQERRNDEFMEAMVAHGLPRDDAVRLRADSDHIDRFLEDTPIDGPVQGGDVVVLGELEAEVVALPGHTPGSSGFLLSEDHHFLSGDTLLERITSNAVELRDEDRGGFHTYWKTIEGLRRYVGVECLPGHHAPFRLTDEILDRHISWHQQRRDRIVGALDRPRSAFGLYPTVFPGVTGDPALFLGMAEIVGHLHAAELDGLVARKDEDGVRKWVRA